MRKYSFTLCVSACACQKNFIHSVNELIRNSNYEEMTLFLFLSVLFVLGLISIKIILLVYGNLRVRCLRVVCRLGLELRS